MEGWGGEGGWGMYLPYPPLLNPYLSVFPTYKCNTHQVVVKTVISAGKFNVSEKKLHLTKPEMGSEVQGTLKRERVYVSHELSTKSLS